MTPEAQHRQTTLAWLFLGLMFVLCGVLGILQYRWIGEISVAARDRMRASLRAALDRVSRDFQTELSSACRAIAPDEESSAAFADRVSARYSAWKQSGRQAQFFKSVGVAAFEHETLVLYMFDADGRPRQSVWPPEWAQVERFLREIGEREGRGPRGGGAPQYDGSVFEAPVFDLSGPGRGFNDRGGARRPDGWIIFDLNVRYAGEVLIPELLQRHLGTAASEYQFEIVPRRGGAPLFASAGSRPGFVAANADDSVGVFDTPPDLFRGRAGGGRGFGFGGGRGFGIEGPGRAAANGRWQLYVRRRAGSLEAVVARTRERNLAIAAGVLLLIVASAAALIRFTRRSQRLAELQMNFVAGVSHEFRTPLTVIDTAAYNLQNSANRSHEQVARYGALIRQESGRLKELVEQVLSFAASRAGRPIQEPRTLAIEDVIETSLDVCRPAAESGSFVVETHIAPGLPLVSGDARALQHALQNLLQNAVKYGGGESNWIGVSASEVKDEGCPVVEIRVADRGPGIPPAEQKQIFDPFFRGKRALEDQVHGTGLGLTLVKEIVAAHGGSITLRSQPGKGTEFVIRIPAAPHEHRNEFANTSG